MYCSLPVIPVLGMKIGFLKLAGYCELWVQLRDHASLNRWRMIQRCLTLTSFHRNAHIFGCALAHKYMPTYTWTQDTQNLNKIFKKSWKLKLPVNTHLLSASKSSTAFVCWAFGFRMACPSSRITLSHFMLCNVLSSLFWNRGLIFKKHSKITQYLNVC